MKFHHQPCRPRSVARRHFLGLLAVLFLLPALAIRVDAKPNIVVLYADDAGYADFGFQEKADPKLAALTPHITKLAREGVRFTSAYMSGAVCSPSRAGLMTGRYQQRFGHELNIPPGYMKQGLPLSEKFIGDRLREHGYRTGLIGKWHLGYPADYHPNKRGFDHFYGCLQGARSYYPYPKAHDHRVIQENGTATTEGGYTTDRFGDGACSFIEANKDKPFYLFVSFTAPHGPLQPRKADLAKLTGFSTTKRANYAGLVKALDDNVGKILAKLESLKLSKNTLVIFTNDNGGQTLTGAVNTPLKGRKGQLSEGGIRVPMAMRWPGTIKPDGVIHDPVISLDFLPTFLAIAGGKPDPSWKLDGVNLLPRIKGDMDSLRERTLYWRNRGKDGPIALREGKWKLVHNRGTAGAKPELYDLSKDIGEASDLADSSTEKLGELRKKLAGWEAQLIEPLWKSAPRKGKKKASGEAK